MSPMNRVIAIAVVAAAAAGAHGQTRQWVSPVDGNWNVASNWSPMDVPNSGAESALLGVPGMYTVTLDITAEIDGLSITEPNATLAMPGGRTLGIHGLTNDGVILVDSNNSASAVQIRFDADTTIGGSGRIEMNRQYVAILTTNTGVTVTNAADHTIAGEGELYASLINDGTVRADRTGLALRLIAGAKQNNGVFGAENGGILDIQPIPITQGPAGVIVADNATVQLTGSGSSITGGQIQTLNGGVVTRAPGESYLSGVTLDGSLNVTGGGQINILGADLVNNGVITVDANNSATASVIRFDQNVAFAGSGRVEMNRSSVAVLTTNTGVTATNGPDHTIVGAGLVYAYLTNNGVISADRDSQTLLLGVGAKTNNNIMQATGGGVLELADVNITNGPSGRIVADDSPVLITGAAGGSITGGSLETVGAGAFTRRPGTTYLNGVTNSGRFDIDGGGYVIVLGSGLTNDGVITVDSNFSASAATIRVDANTTIGGSGRIAMNRQSVATLTTNTGISFTNGATHTISGQGIVPAAMTNNGVIDADTAGTALVLTGAAKTNNSVMRATGGGLLDVQSVDIAQGPAGRIVADGGDVRLLGATASSISSGTLGTTGSSRITRYPGTTYLNSATLNGDLDIEGGGVIIILGGGLTNNGTLTIDSNNSSSATILRFDQTGTLGGAGRTVLARAAAAQLTTNTGIAMTNGQDHTICGAGVMAGSFINQGTISPGLDDGDKTEAVSVAGALYLDTGSSLELDIAGPTTSEFDRLTGTAVVTLGGACVVRFAPGYTPTLGDSFTVITGVAVMGDFDQFIAPAVGGYAVRPYIDSTTVRVRVVCAADLNADQTINVFDLLQYLSWWFPDDPHAELTGDVPPSVDVFDLLAYLTTWFAGCS